MKKKNNRKKSIPLLLTYNRTITNISEVVSENWDILQINPESRNAFDKEIKIYKSSLMDI